MIKLKVGQMIPIHIKRGQKTAKEYWKVYQIYKHFVVLENGLYKTCAFYNDIRRNIPVVLYSNG